MEGSIGVGMVDSSGGLTCGGCGSVVGMGAVIGSGAGPCCTCGCGCICG